MEITDTTTKLSLTKCQEIALSNIKKWLQDSDASTHCLYGSAGTGKSFLCRMIVNWYSGKMCITAPTHKAKKIASDFTGLPAVTIHSLLGLQPDTSIENFDINNVVFSQKNRPTIYEYNLIILDECSMVNDDLFDYMMKEAQAHNVKVLFVGDRCQLPPINKKDKDGQEEVSKCFVESEGISIMVTPARQKPSNPLMCLLYSLRYDIEKNEDAYNAMVQYYKSFNLEHLLDKMPRKHLPKKIVHLYNLEGKLGHANEQGIPLNAYKTLVDHYPTLLSDDETEGYVHYGNNIQEFDDQVLNLFGNDNFKVDTDYVKYLAFTNENIRGWNTYIRRYLLPDAEEFLAKGDLITSYASIKDEDWNLIFVNSEDYIITYFEESIEEVELVSAEEISVVPIKGWHVEFTSTQHGRSVLFVVHPKSADAFIKAHSYLLRGGRKFGKWKKYFAFKRKFLVTEETVVQFGNRKDAPKKDLDYGYGITVHKSQGSSYSNVAISVKNIKNAYNIWLSKMAELEIEPTYEQRYAQQLFVLKLLYVAYSRAKQIAYASH